jgi:hypothetical protein
VADGLTACHDPNAPQAQPTHTICVVDASGRVYRGHVTGAEWLEGPGWTHSQLAQDASTLSPTDQTRCAPALSATTPACQ